MTGYLLAAGWLFAQMQGQAPAADGAGDAAPAQPPFWWTLAPLAVMFLLYMFLFRPDGKRASQQKMFLQNLKKNDKVVTAGGIFGVVSSVQREANRVTLKVDESNNTKIDVLLSSIERVIDADEPADKSK